MNRQLLCSAIALVLITTKVVAQKESKTFKETFTIGENAVLNITTSNTDIEFETWDKNQVEIIATLEIEGATKDEAKYYFDKDEIKIQGNSKEIEIRTGLQNISFLTKKGRKWIESDSGYRIESLFEDLKFPELSNLSHLSELTDDLLDLKEELSELAELMVIPEMPVIPNLPPMPEVTFDYEEYKKDGDKYIKKWKKQFEKGFDEDFKKDFEEWGEEFEKLNKERSKQMIKTREKQKIAYEKRREKLLAEREKKQEIRNQMKENRKQKYESRRERLTERRDSLRFSLRDSLRTSKPNIFYFSSNKESKSYKVKKTIKIKMPKSVKLKMNVRHGEVKLASITKNLEASLQYASLLGYTIDGTATNIQVAYSPVVVQKWNYGQLKTDYSDIVNLKEVGELRLNSVSSKVVIDKLNKSVLLTNSFGEVLIESVATNFKDIDVSIKNGEFSCIVPKTPISFYLNSTKSNIKYPLQWNIERAKNYDNMVYKGYQTSANSNKSIRVDAKYSEVTLEN